MLKSLSQMTSTWLAHKTGRSGLLGNVGRYAMGLAALGVTLGTATKASAVCTNCFGVPRCSGCSGSTCPSNCPTNGYTWYCCATNGCAIECRDCDCPGGGSADCYCSRIVGTTIAASSTQGPDDYVPNCALC